MALSCRFQRQWADVEALTCAHGFLTRATERDGIRVTEVGELGRFQSAPLSPLFPFYLRRAKADIVVIHVPNPTAEVAYLLARPSGKLVVRYQSDVVRQKAAMRFYGPLQMKFLRKADIILAASDNYVETSQVLAPLRDRCRVIPLGILPEEFDNPDPDRVATLRERYGGGYVFFSGRHRYYKGLEYLVRAAATVKAPVVVAGDGPERASCETLACETGGRTFFTGALTQGDLVDHLHGCEIFAFPSVARSEAFGIAMLEAQACGKPVVATRLGTGVEFVNLDGKTGVNVPPRDPDALAEAINGLLDDPMRARAMGAFARKRVEQEFHAERVARAEFEVYQGLLE